MDSIEPNNKSDTSGTSASSATSSSKRELNNVCVFCGSRDGKNPLFREKTEELANEMVKRKLELVYGGGTVGLMGILSHKIHKAGGKITGFIPEALAPREVSGQMLGDTVVVKDMHTRKLMMYKRANAFIALPGGFGTFEELTEVITWGQLGIHSKPIGLLNVANYYDPLLKLIENAVDEGFIGSELAKKILVVSSEPSELLDLLEQHQPPVPTIKWLSEDQI